MALKKHIDDIREGLETDRYPDEAAVSQGIVLRLLGAVGWSTFDTQVVVPQYGMEGSKVDYALCHPSPKPLIFIEVKRVGNIEGAERQLFEYAFHKGVPIAILTDGREWRFFHPIAQGDYRERRVRELNLSEDNSEESAGCLNRYLNYESICTGEAIEAIKADYEKVVQERQVATQLPEAWSKLVEKEDEFLLHAVSEETKSLCGYPPTDDQVFNFLKSLKIETEPDNGNSGNSTRNSGLLVTMPNGKIVNHSRSVDTFVEIIEKLGIERVRNLEKTYIIPLISTSKHPTYVQRKSGRYYIMTNTDTKTKKRLLEEIAVDLREPLKVEIVDK